MTLPSFHRGWSALALLAVALGSSAPAQADLPAEIDYNTHIRPILSDKCYACHGPDAAERQGGFRLDEKDSAFGEADSGLAPITPGDLENSELVARIMSDEEGYQMPPVETNKHLKPEEKELIKAWIAQGATWKQHWSLVPPVRPSLPKVDNPHWPVNEIDHFILARLQREGLRPAPPADKETLLRRVTLDLTGLPPTPEEIDDFLTDHTPNAYEKVVERLLASPRFGEHLARFWLDGARYADTHGMHLDNYREMWPYRDWVINAFNQNMPFDEFATEQVAGDLLPEPTLEQLVATGFNRCHVTTNEGGSIEDEVQVRNVVDRVTTFGTVFMGLTLECTRCHDHKYDPLTMEDFYSMYAFFNSLDAKVMDGNKEDYPPVVQVPSPEQRHLRDELDAQIAALEKRLSGPWQEVDALQTEWEASLQQSQDGEQSTERILLGEWYSVGPFSETRRYQVEQKQGPEGKPIDLKEKFKKETGEEFGWQRRPSWSDGVIHKDIEGDYAANFFYRTIISPKKQTVTVGLGSDDGYRVYLNGKEIGFEDVTREAKPNQAKLELKLKKGENELLVKLMNFGGEAGYYFQLDPAIDTFPQELYEAAQLAPSDRTPEQHTQARELFRNRICDFPELVEVREQLADARRRRGSVERAIPTTLVWKELEKPAPAHILGRGSYDAREREVGRRTPALLPPMADDLPKNRLGLARWMLADNHPLTARVTVNRFWQQIFGTGLVRTAEDFGSQGEPPSHPELLDWLAVDFREGGWDLKDLLRRMVTSATYRQSSHVAPELYQRDPANRLLARGPRYRLDGEMLRDQALLVSGLLVNRLGGPGVKPPQPELWSSVAFPTSNTSTFVADKGPEKIHRRTLYTFIKRTSTPPQMSTFDGPSRETCTVRRERTNTPLQALLLLNDPQYFEAAQELALRTLREGGADDASRAAYMFRLCTARQATSDEMQDMLQAVHEEREIYADDSAAAEQLAGSSANATDGFDNCEVSAWTVLANTLLNMDEVLSKN